MLTILLSICFGFIGFILASITDIQWIGVLGIIVGTLSPALYMIEKIYRIETKKVATLQLEIKELEKQLKDSRC